MNIYRFLGAYSEIGGVGTLDSLGQSIKLDPKVALEAMRGGAVLIPDAEYQKLGFTKEEEKAYQYVGSRATAPAELKAKILAGLKVYQKQIDEAAMAETFTPEVMEVLSPALAQQQPQPLPNALRTIPDQPSEVKQ